MTLLKKATCRQYQNSVGNFFIVGIIAYSAILVTTISLGSFFLFNDLFVIGPSLIFFINLNVHIYQFLHIPTKLQMGSTFIHSKCYCKLFLNCRVLLPCAMKGFNAIKMCFSSIHDSQKTIPSILVSSAKVYSYIFLNVLKATQTQQNGFFF